jgi:hypothetical protein
MDALINGLRSVADADAPSFTAWWSSAWNAWCTWWDLTERLGDTEARNQRWKAWSASQRSK